MLLFKPQQLLFLEGFKRTRINPASNIDNPYSSHLLQQLRVLVKQRLVSVQQSLAVTSKIAIKFMTARIQDSNPTPFPQRKCLIRYRHSCGPELFHLSRPIIKLQPEYENEFSRKQCRNVRDLNKGHIEQYKLKSDRIISDVSAFSVATRSCALNKASCIAPDGPSGGWKWK